MGLARRVEAAPKGKAGPLVVIGAGIAGIAAARELKRLGHSVILLEGRERIGGRIWTSESWDKEPMDLGASWIHGTRGNPLTALAKQAGAKLVATDSEEWPVHDSGGHRLEHFDAFERKASRDIEQALLAARARQQDQSVLAAIEAKTPLAKMAPERREPFEFLLNSQIEQEYGDDLSQLSAKLLWEGESYGGDEAILPQGYSTIIEHLAKGLDIRKGEAVHSIEWKGDGVNIITTKGEHAAQRVVITLPIGVLQQGTVRFDPPLPKEKKTAIDQIGAGILNKVCLKFPKVFWPKDADWIGAVSAQRGEFCDWLSLHRTTGQPVLMAFNSGSFARKLEGWPDQKMVEQAMQVLRRIYGDQTVEPTGVQITRWASDPFALCSYSSPRLGMTDQSRKQLAKAVGGRLFFAGEATHAKHPSTVHGAWLSGQRAAREIGKA